MSFDGIRNGRSYSRAATVLLRLERRFCDIGRIGRLIGLTLSQFVLCNDRDRLVFLIKKDARDAAAKLRHDRVGLLLCRLLDVAMDSALARDKLLDQRGQRFGLKLFV